MFLRKGTTYFMLEIEGYEFQDATEKDDANWLNVSIKACDRNNLTWNACNSCLRTFELLELREWFEKIVKNPIKSEQRISFTENELSFIYTDNTLIIALDFDFHPNRVNYDYDSDEEYHLNFDIDDSILLHICDFLNKKIKQYPIRI